MEFKPQTLYDALGAMSGGVNAGDSPLDLPPEVMAGAINTTVSGKNATHRPPYYNRPVTYVDVAGQISPTQSAVQQGQYQGGTETVCLNDSGNSWVIALISGRVFSFGISGNVITCTELLIYSGCAITGQNSVGGTVGAIPAIQPQAWLWQSELWVIIQDGLNNPIVVNLNTQIAVRSPYAPPSFYTSVTSSGWTLQQGVPPVGSSDSISLVSVTGMVVGTVVTLKNHGTLQVTNIAGHLVTMLNVSAVPAGFGSVIGSTTFTWQSPSTVLSPGRMGAYGGQRNWMSLVAGTQFIAGDISGGSSGTPAFNFRDAVLNTTENSYIVGGGTFSIPGNHGPITAMKFLAVQNVALGQGPLQVCSAKVVYSCQAPVDRLTWQSVTNPILTEAVITNGAKGQWSTVVANSDLFMRSIDGIRSLTLAQLESNQWGTVPCSFEVSPVLNLDTLALLNYGSAIVFGNRLLHTVGPVQTSQGVYFTGLVPLNFDPTSSLRGKAPAVWDSGTWFGSGPTSQMQILQLTVGEVAQAERAFAFVLNTTASPNQIEFWEILDDGQATADNDGSNDIPIPWQFDSASIRFGVPRKDHVYMQLSNGEIWVDNLVGTVTFQVLYKPDQFPAWTPWRAWQSKQTQNAPNSQPAFLPRVGLGQPSGIDLDFSTNRPMRNGFTFQTRHVVKGHCVFLGEFYEAQTVPMPKFAPMVTTPLSP